MEGSTRLLKPLRDRYGDILAEHQRVVRQAFAAHGGEEVDTQGDAFPRSSTIWEIRLPSGPEYPMFRVIETPTRTRDRRIHA